MKRILFVCLGNICRSPLAEGIFNYQVESNGLASSLMSDSAGTASYHIGSLPDHRSIEVAAQHGIELTHKARAVQLKDFDLFDVIVAMDKTNLSNLQQIKPEESNAELLLMRDFDTVDKGSAVPDPYYGDSRNFLEVYEILNRCMPVFIRYLQS
ncbi:MAG: low molecular weight phosphotyrosine protein phosphatase [Bacteroidia bacterium]|jgi:protein-tyrosine phosphatase|nr:low molecular weight phosphotyrosine protein phosphatase [Bacteroidia bacterium]